MSQTINELAAELAAATKALTEASEKARAASSAETNAVNAVNKLQKELDAVVKKMRDEAPWNTDWAVERKRASAVRAA